MRRVFFSFEYKHDVTRAMIVRHSWLTPGREAAGFIDAAKFEDVQRTGDAGIKKWIREQMHGTSVTVVLVGSHTCDSRYVQYEIDYSKDKGKGLFGIDISGLPGFDKKTSRCCGRMPAGFPFYRWTRDHGPKNLGIWIESAARQAGR